MELFFIFSILLFITLEILTRVGKRMEINLRENDKLLRRYWYESQDDRMDGWWKLHYKKLYYLELQKKIGTLPIYKQNLIRMNINIPRKANIKNKTLHIP